MALNFLDREEEIEKVEEKYRSDIKTRFTVERL
jgi:AAA+ ATPase superfamily predicted ATPase